MSIEETYDSPELLEEEMDFSEDWDKMPEYVPVDITKNPWFDELSLIKRRNIGKIAEYLMENPQATIPEIWRGVGLSVWCVHLNLQELEKFWTKDGVIVFVVNKAKKNLWLAQKLQRRFLDQLDAKTDPDRPEKEWKPAEKITNQEIREVSHISNDEIKRIAVLWWTITDENWWLKETALTDIQQDAINSLLQLW